MKIKLQDFLKIAIEVLEKTAEGLDTVEQKLHLVAQVVSLALLSGELEIEEPHAGRELHARMLSADILARIKALQPAE
jgi:hypothetical protein